MTDPNYPDFDRRVKDALAQVKAPEAVKAQTLAAIEAHRITPQRRRHRWMAPLAAAACLLLAAVLCFAGWRVWQEPAAFVSVDVNPSIELTVNAFDRVVAAKGVNEDGSAVLAQVSVCGKTYEGALSALMGSDAMTPYVAADAFVDVNVTCANDDTAAALEAQSAAVMSQYPCRSVCERSDEATREAALAAGMGVGRYRMASELAELDDSVTPEDCADMTMRQLEDAVGELCHDESHDHGTGHGTDNGQNVSGGQHGQGHGSGNGSNQGHHHS